MHVVELHAAAVRVGVRPSTLLTFDARYAQAARALGQLVALPSR